MVHNDCFSPSVKESADRPGITRPDRFTKGPRRVCLGPACCLVHQAGEVTPAVIRQVNGGDMSGFTALMDCATSWMGALIAGRKAPLCAQRMGVGYGPRKVALPGPLPGRPRVFPAWDTFRCPKGRLGRGRSYIYALPSRCSRGASSGTRWTRLSAKPLAGRLGGPAHLAAGLGRSRAHGPPICAIRKPRLAARSLQVARRMDGRRNPWLGGPAD
jgi:hypothetical protein